jgi:AAA+ superfamily predicted ATPase
MENLDGILIATTNLTANLDSAFERRFLFKVEFHKPEVAVKAQIWQSMIQELNAEEARHLAETYDFSGGQIENIARKRSIEYVLTGKEVTLEELESYCDHELLHASQAQKRVVGFAKA